MKVHQLPALVTFTVTPHRIDVEAYHDLDNLSKDLLIGVPIGYPMLIFGSRPKPLNEGFHCSPHPMNIVSSDGVKRLCLVTGNIPSEVDEVAGRRKILQVECRSQLRRVVILAMPLPDEAFRRGNDNDV